MLLKQYCKGVAVAGTLLIWTIKWIVRPYGFTSQPLKYFLDVAPNLFGSFLIPFVAYWMFSGKDYRLARLFKISTPFELKLVCVLGFSLTVVNEYLQRVSFFGRTFDYGDIAFSFIGITCAWVVFGRLHSRYAATIEVPLN